MKYVYVDTTPGELASGRPLGSDDLVDLADEDILIAENASLIDSGRLLQVPVAKKPATRTTKKTEEN